MLEDEIPADAIVSRGTDYVLAAPLPCGPVADTVGRFAAQRRRSLERIVGNANLRADLLGTPIRRDRICAALMGDRVAGYLSYRIDGAGATIPLWWRYRAEFGALSGTVRYLATQATLCRGRRDDLYIEGFAVAPEARGRGIGRALLEWLGAEVVRRGKAGWRTEMPESHDDARIVYERAGARLIRTIHLGPAGRLLGTARLSLFRWQRPDR